MLMDMKAQVSMEYLAIFAVATLISIPLVVIYAQQTNNLQADLTSSEIVKISQEIVDAAEEVYYMGEPAQKTVEVNFPKGVKQVIVDEKEITFVVETSDLDFNRSLDTAANLTGSIRAFPGLHIVELKATATQVQITDK